MLNLCAGRQLRRSGTAADCTVTCYAADSQLASPGGRSASFSSPSFSRSGSASTGQTARKLSLSSGKYTVKLASFASAHLAGCSCCACLCDPPVGASAAADPAYLAPEVSHRIQSSFAD